MKAIKVTFAVAAACLMCAGVASAADAAAGEALMKQRPVAQIFAFLFLMLGPFKIIGPFAQMTKAADARLTRQIALQATLFASLALLLAAIIGERALGSYGIPLPILALSAGIILFVVALLRILEQFIPSTSRGEQDADPAPTPTLKMALTPLAFPTIVTPYGIATLIVFMALNSDLPTQLTIGAIVMVIMLLNLIAMLLSRRIPPIAGVALSILGVVLGVIQVALGLQIIHNSLKALGLL